MHSEQQMGKTTTPTASEYLRLLQICNLCLQQRGFVLV